MGPFFYIGQGLGLCATALTALSYQMNTKRSLLAVQTAATLATCVSYFFLGAYSGFALNIVCLVRNLVFFFMKEGTRPMCVATAILTALMVGVGVLSWQGPVSLLILVALAVNTVFLSFGKPQLLRWSILGTSSAVLAYNVIVFTVGGILNEGIAITSSAVGILRFRRTAREKRSKSSEM